MAAVEMIALADMVGEKPQLAGGARPLAFKSGGGQTGLRGADGGDLGCAGLDLVGDAVKKAARTSRESAE